MKRVKCLKFFFQSRMDQVRIVNGPFCSHCKRLAELVLILMQQILYASHSHQVVQALETIPTSPLLVVLACFKRSFESSGSRCNCPAEHRGDYHCPKERV